MKDQVTSSGPSWRALLATSLIATILALVALLGTATLLMMLTLGGFVVIAMDALRLASLVLQGLILVGPVSLALLPALTLLCHPRPRLLRWLLLLAGPLAGGWWGRVAVSWWFDHESGMEGFLAARALIGGLTASIVFVRHLPRSPEQPVLAG